ncbi:NADP-dependent oxidoreductase [Coralloluteibacterium stylophorae]|uniref:NADP-dependent oxidoreductase n=1 Tax=Coralloluteibacterium stylophorae TaxID=1776034 RepID=A0A8J8AX38_9GAMM|nr:NADP-dependent oxidoreductase [Coralloluteibacterium stylophorae]MBS7458682.1 NADP-dependent oxidoreductase [Coralloluteibacterium stylophorae]
MDIRRSERLALLPRSASRSMRAVVYDDCGAPDVLRVAGVPLPEPAAGQVRVRVRAAGVQHMDLAQRGGWFGGGRDDALPFPRRIGSEFAGRIDMAGPGVYGLAVGDDVLGWCERGAYADAVCVPASQCVARPPLLDWAAAAALPDAGQSAHVALACLRLQRGETLLIHGAAGGVGSMAVQLARLAGVRVVGTAREANHAYLHALGAEPVAYGPGLASRVRALAPHGVDAALDAAGSEAALRASLALVAEPARIGSLVRKADAEAAGAQAIRVRRSRTALLELVDLCARGLLHVHLRAVFPMVQAAAAHRLLARGHGCGRVALWMAPEARSAARAP